MRTAKNLFERLKGAKRDVPKPSSSLHLAKPAHNLNYPTETASGANKPEYTLPLTSDLGPGMRSTITEAHRKLFGNRRLFSTSSDVPGESEFKVTLNDHAEAAFRLASPHDAPSMPQFYSTLSPETIRSRWEGDPSQEHWKDLQRACEKGMAYISYNNEKEIMGIGQLIPLPEKPGWAMRAVVISDRYQGKGLGSIMMDQMLLEAERKGFAGLYASFDSGNESGIAPNMGGRRREMWYPKTRRVRWAKRSRPTRKNSSNKLFSYLKPVERVKHK